MAGLSRWQWEPELGRGLFVGLLDYELCNLLRKFQSQSRRTHFPWGIIQHNNLISRFFDFRLTAHIAPVSGHPKEPTISACQNQVF
jgi:hypothetical protein